MNEKKRRKLEKMQDELSVTPEERIQNLLARVVRRLDQYGHEDRTHVKALEDAIKANAEVTVKNLGDIAPLSSIAVSNLGEISRDVRIENFPSVQHVSLERPEWFKGFPELYRVEVTNLPEQKELAQPSWLAGLIAVAISSMGTIISGIASSFFDGLAKLLTQLWGQGIMVTFKRPQPTYLVNPENGAPVDLSRIAQPYSIVSYGGGGSSVTGGGSTFTGTIKTVAFEISATATVIPAVAGKALKVFAVKLIASAAISVKFRDGSSTDLEGAQSLAANGGFVEAVNPPIFIFKTSTNNGLDLVISGVGTASGRITYWEE